MKTIRKLKASRKWIVVLLFAIVCLSAIPMEAANRTITIKTTTGGKFRYRIQTNGTWGGWSDYFTTTKNVTVADGKSVNIQAFPTATNYYFVNWTGTTTQAYYGFSFTVAENRTYTAHFTTSYTNVKLCVNNASYGSAKIYGPFPEQSFTTTSYSTVKVGVGATVLLTGTPATNYYFTKWTGFDERTNHQFSFVAAAGETRSYKTNFTNQFWTITVIPSPNAGGKTRITGPLNTGWVTGTLTQKVGRGSTCVLGNSANSGYILSTWTRGSATGNVVSVADSYTFTPTGNVTYYANFVSSWGGSLAAGNYVITSYGSSGNNFQVNGAGNYSTIGNITVTSGNVNITFNNTRTVYATGMMNVTGGNLNLTNGNNNIVTLKRLNRSGNMLQCIGGNINIQGNSSRGARFVIDGGAIFPDNDARNIYVENVEGFTNHSGAGRLIYAGNDGGVELMNTTLQNVYSFDNGGGICACNLNDTYPVFNLEDVTIQACWAPHGSAIYIQGNDRHGTLEDGAVLKDVLIQYCYAKGNHDNVDSQGGTIRTNGGGRTRMSLDNCEIRYNLTGNPKYGGYGGGIYWNASGEPATRITLKNNTRIHDNKAILVSSYVDPVTGETRPGKSWGGGIMIESRMTIESARIYSNEAKLGGGIYLCTYGGTAEQFEGNGFDLTVTDGVYITDNIATEAGGGVYMSINKSNDIGFSPDGTPISPEFKLDVQGGEISGNSAPLGAGVAIVDKAPLRHYNTHHYYGGEPDPSYHKWSLEYRRNAYIQGGYIQNNYTTLSANETKGAGIYILKTNDPDLDQMGSYEYTYETAGGAGNISVSATGGFVYNNSSMNNYKNGVGGGLYINNSIPQAPYNGTCSMTIGGDVEICDNKSDGNGAGVYIANGDITVNGGTVGKEDHPNIAYNGNGAGFCVANGNVTINGGNVDYNQAKFSNNSGGNGGAFYLTGGIATINGGSVSNNNADKDGGGFYVDVTNTSDTTFIKGGAMVSYNKAVNGGGAYINKGILKVNGATTSIVADTATISGGGIYMANGTVIYTDATMQGNVATSGNGGGLFLGDGSMTVSGGSAAIKGNHALSHGGGVCVASGNFSMTGGTIGGATADGNYTTGTQSQGGGLYMGGGTATISGGAISGNHTDDDGWGGGVFMEGGTCTLSNGATIGGLPNGSLSYANSALFGGGVYSAGGTITVKGGQIAYNKATEAGGGIYSNGDNAKVYIQKEGTLLSNIHHNTADNNDDDNPLGQGGGIYALKGDVVFSDGYIRENFAREQGGGIYVGPTGTLELKGSATLHRNNVPEGQHGGGVYLLGSLTVGETGATGTITAEENFAGATYEYDTIHNADGSIQVNANNRNNVYLPFPEVRDDHTGVITVIENGISTNSHVGFSVPHGNVPVIYCERSETSWDYLHQFSTGQQYQYNLFDDTHRYTAVQYSNIPRFDPDHVYLYGFWTNEVTGDDSGLDYCEVDMNDFEGVDTILISNPCDLAYFISWVNGLNNAPGGTHPRANARLTADIDMSEFGWVPIDNYQGVFDGGGHTVSGIVSMLNTDYTDYGFFGKLNGGTVKNLYVKDASYVLEKKKNHQLFVGGIAGTTSAGSVIENCEASSAIFSDTLNTVMGGLVGRQSGGTVRSSIGIADMTGNLMGGLVGQLEAGNLLNSFANAKFSRMADANAYFGGLVGVNGGTVENCYVRLRGTTPASDKFGWLIGQNNTGGNVQYCYSRMKSGEEKYCANENGGNFDNYRYYENNTVTPYAYARRDNQVWVVEGDSLYIPIDYDPATTNPLIISEGAASDKQMLLCLNEWVRINNAALGPNPTFTYTGWSRPTTKVINDDLPVLLMPSGNAVYCTGNADGTAEGEAYLNYGDVNTMLGSQTDVRQAIWLYDTPTPNDTGANITVGNVHSDAKLYIAERNIAGKPLTVIQSDTLLAYVGVTLDNSANIGGANPTFSEPGTFDYTDWHMFATPLANAPLGIDYEGDLRQWHGEDFGYDYYSHPADMPYYRFFEDGRGYFPSRRYGTQYPANSGLPTAAGNEGNYYKEWDFYTYYEPEYHWINFKRNSNDHWHENAHDAQIHYIGDGVNEGNETTLVKGRGYLLATREETFLQCHDTLNGTDGQITIPVTRQGYYSPGYNFLGNPYLAYLDFNIFAEKNGDLWGSETPNYAVIDEDERGYIYYATDGSVNPATASRYIAPHQGFMILVPDDEDVDLDEGAVFYDGSGNTDDMRNLTGDEGKFRGSERPAYPLVNLFATDDNGNRDMVTVELGRPDKGGARLMRELRLAKGHIWCRHDDQDWAIAFTQPGLTEAAIRFETYQDGEYTLTWNTQNGDFSYLHLVDNLTGADVDCLTQSEYRFMSSTDDYKSRFRLVFGYTGIDDNGDGGTAATGSFAYIATGTLVVNGQGTLELLDVTGRTLASTRLNGPQSTVALPNAAAGVYLLRLTDGNATRTQKIVINH